LRVVTLVAGRVSANDAAPARVEQKSQPVLLNSKTHRFHAPTCGWARNCIRITREDAVKRGGVPCKVCGGR
jgi:hypothetical protein